MNFIQVLQHNFYHGNEFKNEDDIKTNFRTFIIKGITDKYHLSGRYTGENSSPLNGYTDGQYLNIVFEYKKKGLFKNDIESRGSKDALYGRLPSKPHHKKTDHGLFQYLISRSGIKLNMSQRLQEQYLSGIIGIGFDGDNFLIARFKKVPSIHHIRTDRTRYAKKCKYLQLHLKFNVNKYDMNHGLRYLITAMREGRKLPLNKQNIASFINPKSQFVSKAINNLYDYIGVMKKGGPTSRAFVLYKDWERVFGKIYGSPNQATRFTQIVPTIKRTYGINTNKKIDSQQYLFAMQTFFDMFEKLLVFGFISNLVDPSFDFKNYYNRTDEIQIFQGNFSRREYRIVNNFFEPHYLEWFTYYISPKYINNENNAPDVRIINHILKILNKFNLATFRLKPENIQDLLQEVYMNLIPSKMRHIMGEYFSPNWIVQRVLDIAGYHGNIHKSLIDPACGTGNFLTQAIKRIIIRKRHANQMLNYQDLKTICNNLVGFDINPISIIGAKANFILAIFSGYDTSNLQEDFAQSGADALTIPCYAADSVLAPVVYSKSRNNTVKTNTVVGTFKMPQFSDVQKSNRFLNELSECIDNHVNFTDTWNILFSNKLVKNSQKQLISKLYQRIYNLHDVSKDSFWPIILKNTFAPSILKRKFDFVVGNPPWIGWKSMSKNYRDGTKKVWWSYGIYNEKGLHRKITHDDFGMAMTYVSIDKYLALNGTLVFLLPKSFFKSERGGKGFRKFKITSQRQNINFAVTELDDFSNFGKNQLFDVPTVAARFKKGAIMHYPFDNYIVWNQRTHQHKHIDPHDSWSLLKQKLTKNRYIVQPINSDKKSPWLTLPIKYKSHLKNIDQILNSNHKRYYRGRKGIEPDGAKGVFVLNYVHRRKNGELNIRNDISRSRQPWVSQVFPGTIENRFVFPMLSGRDISRWKVKSNEFMIVPQINMKDVNINIKPLSKEAPDTYRWLNHYRSHLNYTRNKNSKFPFTINKSPFYRLDNVGPYTFAPWKVLWKEQTDSMSAVVVHDYEDSVPNADKKLFPNDKVIVVDSKVLMLPLINPTEAYYVCGILNSKSIRRIIDGYAINTNRGTDVLKNIYIPKFNVNNTSHLEVAKLSKLAHQLAKKGQGLGSVENKLNNAVLKLY